MKRKRNIIVVALIILLGALSLSVSAQSSRPSIGPASVESPCDSNIRALENYIRLIEADRERLYEKKHNFNVIFERLKRAARKKKSWDAMRQQFK